MSITFTRFVSAITAFALVASFVPTAVLAADPLVLTIAPSDQNVEAGTPATFSFSVTGGTGTYGPIGVSEASAAEAEALTLSTDATTITLNPGIEDVRAEAYTLTFEVVDAGATGEEETEEEPVQEVAFATVTLIVAGPTVEVGNGTELEAAVAAAAPGTTIAMADGEYNLTHTLTLSQDGVTLSGASEEGVVINAAPAGYGIAPEADGLTLEKFTLNGPTSNYGIKAYLADDLTIRDVTVQGSSKSEFDLNRVTNSLLENITADGKDTAGVGIGLSNVTNIQIDSATTIGNNWGGVGLYDASTGATTGVSFSGGSFSESNPIYIDAEFDFGVSNTDLPSGFEYAVRNPMHRPGGDAFTFFQSSKAAAIAAALALPTNTASYIQEANNSTGALANEFVVGSGMSVKTAIGAATTGATISVDAGTYTEAGQIVIDKDLSLIGDGLETTTLKPAQDITGSNHQDASAWILVNDHVEFDLEGFTLDGTGRLVTHGILSHGEGTIQENAFTNIGSSKYVGMAINLHGAEMTVHNNTFSAIQRVGVYVGHGSDATITENVYTGKGVGDFLDYAFEVGRGGQATINENLVSGNVGVAASDGSTSAGILVTSYFNPETPAEAEITGNTITGNTTGIAVGYDANDLSIVTVYDNSFDGNTEAALSTTKPNIDASNNWWGNATGPNVADRNPNGLGDSILEAILGSVTYEPWYGSEDGDAIVAETETETSNTATMDDGVIMTVTLEEGTVITGDEDWDGDVAVALQVEATATTTLDSIEIDGLESIAPAAAIAIGSNDNSLTLSKAARIVFAGQAGKLVGWTTDNDGEDFTQITAVCSADAQAVVDAELAAGADCALDVGSDLVVWTKHFTTFVAFTATPVVIVETPSDSGTGGRAGNSRATRDTSVSTGSVSGGQVLGASTYNFTADLTIGSTGADVNELQTVLIADGYLRIAAPTGYFGTLTQAALKLWQAAHGVSATGYFGPLTRAAIAKTSTPTMTAEARAALILELLEKVKELQEQLSELDA